MDALRKGWFSELSPDDLAALKGESGEHKRLKSDGAELGSPWPGQAFSLQYDEVLFSGRSKYQDVLVLKSRTYGNVLVLDGAIQCTERDEFSYQEMLAHPALFSHPNPKKVLIVGGGDGGIAREVLKHKSVESVQMCEVDAMVVDVAKKFLPKMSAHFADPRLLLTIGDGFEFLKNHKDEYDVVITDSSDPIGPAESLFGTSYYELISASLREGGVLASQCESIWLHLDLIKHMVAFTRRIFLSVAYAFASVPTYPSGTIGFLLASKTKRDFKTPLRVPNETERRQFRFYNERIHSAAFQLPTFAAEALDAADS